MAFEFTPDKIDKARKAGYSDQQIQSFLASKGINWAPTPPEVVNEPGLEEVPGPITNALMLGIGGASAPLKSIAPQAIKTTESIPAVAQTIGKSLGRVGEVAFAPLKSTSEAAINAAEQAAGVTLKSPVTKQIAKEVGLPKGSQTFADVTNVVKTKLQGGEKLPLQTAKDFLNKAETVFKQPLGKAEKANLSQTVKLVREYLNKEIKGRAKPATDLANAYLRSNIVKGATGAGALIEGLRRLSRWGR